MTTSNCSQNPAPSASLKKNFQWVLAGNIVNAACQWAVISVLAKLGGAETLGTYLLIMAVVLPVTTLSKLQMRSIFVTDAANRFPFADYFGTGMVATGLGLAAIVIYGFSVSYDPTLLLTLTLIGLARSLDNPSEVLLGYWQKQEKMHFVGLAMMIRGTTTLIAVAVAFALTNSLTVAAGGLVIAALLRIFLYELPVSRHLAALPENLVPLQFTLSRSAIGPIVAMGVPLGLVLFLGTLSNSIVRLVLESSHGKEQLAYFGAAAYPLMVGTMAMGALGQSASPRLARFFHDRDRRYWLLLGKMTAIATGIGLAVLTGVWLLGKPALELLYDAEYSAYHREFIIMAAGSVFLFVSSSLGYGLTAARRFNHQLIGAVIGCLTAALLAWQFIPDGGIRAAAWVYLGVALTGVLTRLVILALAHRNPPHPGPGEQK